MLVCQFRHVPRKEFGKERGNYTVLATILGALGSKKNMTLTTNQYMIRQKAEALKTWIESFLRDCKVRDLSAFTIGYYRAQLAAFESFCCAHDVTQSNK
jgi:hypothetical protein